MSSASSPPSDFVKAGTGEIKIAKLVSTILSALWITVAAGWIAVARAIAQVHISMLNAAAGMYSQILLAFGRGATETTQVAWGAAFRSAVEASPMLAPVLFSIEIVVVMSLLIGAARRWA